MKNALMMDYETAGLQPAGRLLTCGGLSFNLDGEITDIVDIDGNIKCQNFYHRIIYDDQYQENRVIDQSVIEWWGEQPEDVQNEAFGQGEDRITLPDHIKQLHQFIIDNNISCVYANSPRFDLALLEHACKGLGVDFFINYMNERCVRTVEDVVFGGSHVRKNLSSVSGVPIHDHNALDDSIKQAITMVLAHKVQKKLIEASGLEPTHVAVDILRNTFKK